MRPDDENNAIRQAAYTLLTMRYRDGSPTAHPRWGFPHRTAPGILSRTKATRQASLFPYPKPSKPVKASAIPQSHITDVHFHRASQKWAIQIRISGERFALGYYATVTQASTLLLNVLSTLNGTPTTDSEAQYFAGVITKRVSVNTADIAKRIEKLRRELSALAAPEGSSCTPGA